MTLDGSYLPQNVTGRESVEEMKLDPNAGPQQTRGGAFGVETVLKEADCKGLASYGGLRTRLVCSVCNQHWASLGPLNHRIAFWGDWRTRAENFYEYFVVP